VCKRWSEGERVRGREGERVSEWKGGREKMKWPKLKNERKRKKDEKQKTEEKENEKQEERERFCKAKRSRRTG
jgi:hypothetical protein